jgi:putative phage-type endonuclease
MIVRCKDEEEWLLEREKLITASDVAAIFGLDPRRSPLDVYVQKKTGNCIPENDAMLIGHSLEDGIADIYVKKTGRMVGDPGDFTILIHDEATWLGATLDRLVSKIIKNELIQCIFTLEPEMVLEELQGGGIGPLELKHAGWMKRKEWELGCPLWVEIQLQTQIACVGSEFGAYCGIVGGSEIHCSDVDRNENFIKQAIKKADEFRWRLKHNRPPPVTSPTDLCAVKTLYGIEDGETINLDESVKIVADDWEQSKYDLRLSAEMKDTLEAELRFEMRDASFGILPDGTMLVRKKSKDGKNLLRRVCI